MGEYEYGIQHIESGEMLRTGMTEQESIDWINDFLERNEMPGYFRAVRCNHGTWEAWDVYV